MIIDELEDSRNQVLVIIEPEHMYMDHFSNAREPINTFDQATFSSLIK
ncbi:MAG: hypothetical protein RLQ12_09295 [Cyclobacteriaceae bacterium]